MKIRVLGCFGGEYFDRDRRFHPCGFLVDDTLLLDGGTISSALNLEGMRSLSAVLVTHAHLDHIQGIAHLADNLFGKIERPVEVVGVAPVLTALKKHFFNGKIWPDFSRLPNAKEPVLRFRVIVPNRTTRIGPFEVTAVPVNHIVPAVGFLVRSERRTLLYSGDTAPTEKIWEVARRRKDLAAAFVESSFPDRMGDLALRSGHLTPTQTLRQFERIGRPDVPLYVYHMKPQYAREIRGAFVNLAGRANVTPISDGQEILL